MNTVGNTDHPDPVQILASFMNMQRNLLVQTANEEHTAAPNAFLATDASVSCKY